jgi:hypothetical protein
MFSFSVFKLEKALSKTNFKLEVSHGFLIYCHKPTLLMAFSRASISVYPVSKMYLA